MTDHNLRDIASGCEAKLHGVRRTADGVVVSFVLHPAEIPPALMLDPLGTRYMLAFVAIADDEQPLPASHPGRVVSRIEGADDGATQWICTQDGVQCIHNSGPDCPGCIVERSYHKPQKDAAGLTPKARYAAMTAGEQARVRAGRLPRNEGFRAWATEQLGGPSFQTVTEEAAKQFIRDRCCGGQSRRRIATEPECCDKFLTLETQYRIDIGELPEPR